MKLTKKTLSTQEEVDHILGFTLVLEKLDFCRDTFVKINEIGPSWTLMILDI